MGMYTDQEGLDFQTGLRGRVDFTCNDLLRSTNVNVKNKDSFLRLRQVSKIGLECIRKMDSFKVDSDSRKANMTAFTHQEIVAIDEFRRRVADVLPKDEFKQRDDFLIRWIRAREMNLDKAEEMLRNSMQWRKDNQIDNILSKALDPELCEKFPYYIDGLDKTGRPVITFPFGKWNIKSFIEADGPTRFNLYINQLLENIGLALRKCTCAKTKGNNHDPTRNESKDQPCIQFVAIADLTGYSFLQLANMKVVQMVIQMVSIYEAHYPETLGVYLGINAPSIFSILFGMTKPFMSGRTLDKMKIFGSDKEQWQRAVLELVEPSQIREEYGGTKVSERL